MIKTGTPYLFVNSLHGREALFLYPAALFTWLLGASPLTLRLASVVAGILAVPLLYRLTIVLLRDHPLRHWIALAAAAALATSFWHIAMSRVGLRQVIIGEFPLSISQSLTAGSYRLVTGMYDLASGIRLPALDSNGQPWPDNAILLTRFTQP